MILGQQLAHGIQPSGDRFENRGLLCGGQFLVQPGQSGTRLQPALPGVRCQFPGQYLEQGGFTGAIAAQQPETLAGLELESNTVQNDVGAKMKLDRFQAQQGHGDNPGLGPLLYVIPFITPNRLHLAFWGSKLCTHTFQTTMTGGLPAG